MSEKLAPREGVFFAANALTYLARVAAGATDRAHDEGRDAERALRESVNGISFRDGRPHRRVPDELYLGEYVTLPDPEGAVTVWRIDGNLARSYYKADYTQGGHGIVYPWVPTPRIWVEDGCDCRELPFVVCHEYLERRLMRDSGLEYACAHAIASALEYDLRKGRRLTGLARGRKLGKADLPGLAEAAVYEFVDARFRPADGISPDLAR